MSTFAVIIPSAGQSSRFGGLEKKPFVSLDGRPIWLRTAELFWSRVDVSRTYLVIAPDDRESFRSRFGHLLAFANAELIEGGKERFESVENALKAVPSEVDYVAVHDAVRPLVTGKLIDTVFAASRETGAAILALPVADTLKRVDGSVIRETVPRSVLWCAQTPQIFRRDLLVDAYRRRSEWNHVSITDDSQLMELCGHHVTVIPGSPTNFKITTQDDLVLAEAVLKSRVITSEQRTSLRGYGEEAEW